MDDDVASIIRQALPLHVPLPLRGPLPQALLERHVVHHLRQVLDVAAQVEIESKF